MTESQMKELLWSLAWYDCSCYHSINAKEILKQAYPESDFGSVLEEFRKAKTLAPQEGCPR